MNYPKGPILPLESFRDFELFLAQFTNYERLGQFQHDKRTLGLSRIRRLLTRCGEPQDSLRIVHIAGTKGKGSTALMLEALLTAAGHRVGVYLSPHVEHLSERIRLNGASVSESVLVDTVNRVVPILTAIRDEEPRFFPTFFELMTALALLVFRRDAVDWAILEVGLGGRLDATNVVTPQRTVITSIGLEHTAQLGDTLAAIAKEKAGIIKPRVPLVVGPVMAEAEEVIRHVAAENDAPITVLNSACRDVLAVDAEADEAKIEAPRYGVSAAAGAVLGPALRRNLAIALHVYESILSAEGRRVEADAIARALEQLSLPARAEFFPGDPLVVVDSAHTPEGVAALRATLNEHGAPAPWCTVFSLAKGKQLERIAAELQRFSGSLIFTRGDSVRSEDPEVLRQRVGRGEVLEPAEMAFATALEHAGTVIVTGSFYLAGRLRPLAHSRQRQPS